MIGNVTFTNSADAPSYFTGASLTTNMTALSDVTNGKYLLSGDVFSELQSFIEFNSVRSYCYKPSTGRTLDAIVNGLCHLQYLLNSQTTNCGSFCGSIVFLPDDTSGMQATGCEYLQLGIGVPLADRLYNHFFYKNGAHHVILVVSTRMECDDYNVEGNNFDNSGEWHFFVR